MIISSSEMIKLEADKTERAIHHYVDKIRSRLTEVGYEWDPRSMTMLDLERACKIFRGVTADVETLRMDMLRIEGE